MDVKAVEEAVERIRARFKASLLRAFVGIGVGVASPLPPLLLGAGAGCAVSLSLGLIVYMASVGLLKRLWGGLLTERQLYTTGVLSFLAGWGLGFIVSSQALYTPPPPGEG